MTEGAYKNDVFTRARVEGYGVALALVLLACVLGPLLALGAPPPSKTQQAVADLRSPDAQTRMLAAQALAGGAAAAAPDLLSALKAETSPLVREHLVAALAASGDKRAVPALLEAAAKDPAVGVRVGAVAALHRLGDPAAWDALEKLAADPAQPAAVRRGCLIVTGARKAEAALPTLKAAAADKDPWVREAAVDALGGLEGAEARAAVEKALADGDAEVRATARRLSRPRGKSGASGVAPAPKSGAPAPGGTP